MIVISTYPNAIADSCFSLADTLQLIYDLLPKGQGLHILPFGYSTGDAGYFQTDWASFDQKYGDLSSLTVATDTYNVIADGIYNHISSEHPLAKSFFDQPDLHQHLFYTKKQRTLPPGPRSPRGGSALTRFIHKDGQTWWYWQTFPPGSIDVNLNNPVIIDNIHEHQDFLKRLNIKGIRLDAPAYYGKAFSNNWEREDNEQSVILARKVAKIAIKNDFFVIAQLDTGDVCNLYFSDNYYRDVISLDYSFSALVIYSLLVGNVCYLVNHIKATTKPNIKALRPLRTHDGIFLRSKNLNSSIKNHLVEWAKKEQLALRIVDDDPYEINNSLFRVLSHIAPQSLSAARLELAILATLLTPGYPYFYLPAILGWEPELDSINCEGNEDLRTINRTPMDSGFIKRCVNGGFYKRLRTILKILSEWHLDEFKDSEPEWSAVESVNSSCLLCVKNNDYRCYLNFSSKESQQIIVENNVKVLASRGFLNFSLNPLAYVLFRLDNNLAKKVRI